MILVVCNIYQRNGAFALIKCDRKTFTITIVAQLQGDHLTHSFVLLVVQPKMDVWCLRFNSQGDRESHARSHREEGRQEENQRDVQRNHGDAALGRRGTGERRVLRWQYVSLNQLRSKWLRAEYLMILKEKHSGRFVSEMFIFLFEIQMYFKT